jgi:hypothetical protein
MSQGRCRLGMHSPVSPGHLIVEAPLGEQPPMQFQTCGHGRRQSLTWWKGKTFRKDVWYLRICVCLVGSSLSSLQGERVQSIPFVVFVFVFLALATATLDADHGGCRCAPMSLLFHWLGSPARSMRKPAFSIVMYSMMLSWAMAKRGASSVGFTLAQVLNCP